MPESGLPAHLMALRSDPPVVLDQDAVSLAQTHYGLKGLPQPLWGERDRNLLFRQENGGGDLILKFSNPAEDMAVLELQSAALAHIAAQDPSLPVPRIHPGLDARHVQAVTLSDGQVLMLRAQTYLQGVPLAEGEMTPAKLCESGALAARLDLSLRGFFHPAARPGLAWDLMKAERLLPCAETIEDPAFRAQAEGILRHLGDEAAPRLSGLRAQVIHNDLHPGNLLVDAEGDGSICGLIDFGDMLHAPLVVELGVALAEISCWSPQPLPLMASFLAGYESVLPLEPAERALLHSTIMARLAMALAILSWRAGNQRQADSRERHLIGEYQQALEILGSFGPVTLLAALYGGGEVAGEGVEPPVASTDDLRARRARLLGPDLSLSYRKPLHLVRGRDVWLYDAEGGEYLDAYNNVAHVGHCHPDVTAAIARQAALLNTNTRYLHETILDFSETLTGLMPEGLDVCFFVNSGSEANDIALQMAKAYSGGAGELILAHAYHGVTEATFAISPEEYDPVRRPAHVEILEQPDSYRGRLRGEGPAVAEGYAQDCERALAVLAGKGMRPAAVIVDSGTSSAGILDLPMGYLPTVVDKVRAVGGLYIADEVQVGLGRPGGHFWGFEALGAMPDIVTLGKPVGNGHPLGVVVTKREILSAFNAENAFFSTFGGNPVSSAAGLEVLRVLLREGLQQNARDTGAYLKEGLKTLAERAALIGDVRGTGLLIGIDLVKDPGSRAPAPEAAVEVANRLSEAGVLVGRTGPHGNVLKVRPPMTFRKPHADRLIAALAEALKGL